MLNIDPAQPLTITATPVEAGGRPRERITVAGELDLSSAPLLAGALDEHREAGHDVELELSDVSFIDSSGIRVLVQGAASARETGCALELCEPLPRQMHRVFEVAGLLERFVFVSGPGGGESPHSR